MPLQVICQNCKETIRIEQDELTRPDLAHKIGETFQQQCSKCLATREYHVNKVTRRIGMEQAGILGGVSVFLALAITVFAWYKGWFVGIGLGLGAALFLIGYSSMKKNEQTFNGYRLPRTK